MMTIQLQGTTTIITKRFQKSMPMTQTCIMLFKHRWYWMAETRLRITLKPILVMKEMTTWIRILEIRESQINWIRQVLPMETGSSKTVLMLTENVRNMI